MKANHYKFFDNFNNKVNSFSDVSEQKKEQIIKNLDQNQQVSVLVESQVGTCNMTSHLRLDRNLIQSDNNQSSLILQDKYINERQIDKFNSISLSKKSQKPDQKQSENCQQLKQQIACDIQIIGKFMILTSSDFKSPLILNIENAYLIIKEAEEVGQIYQEQNQINISNANKISSTQLPQSKSIKQIKDNDISFSKDKKHSILLLNFQISKNQETFIFQFKVDESEAVLIKNGMSQQALLLGNLLQKLRFYCIEQFQNSDFNILKEIGQGSQGSVFKVQKINQKSNFDLNILSRITFQDGDKHKNNFALKKIDKMLESQQLKSFLINEIKIQRRVTKHKCKCVKLIQVFEDDQNIYLLMDYMRGGNLRDYLQNLQKLENDSQCNKSSQQNLESSQRMIQVKSIIQQVLKSLNRVHQLGILHRDLKPQNILLGSKYRDYNQTELPDVYLADFGLSTYESNDQMEGQLCGTPGYMPPEAFQSGQFTQKSDIFSVGCVLYFLVSNGRHLFKPINPKSRKFLKVTQNNSMNNQDKRNLICSEIFQDKLQLQDDAERIMRSMSNPSLQLLTFLINPDHIMRANITEALEQEWFLEVSRKISTLNISKITTNLQSSQYRSQHLEYNQKPTPDELQFFNDKIKLNPHRVTSLNDQENCNSISNLQVKQHSQRMKVKSDKSISTYEMVPTILKKNYNNQKFDFINISASQKDYIQPSQIYCDVNNQDKEPIGVYMNNNESKNYIENKLNLSFPDSQQIEEEYCETVRQNFNPVNHKNISNFVEYVQILKSPFCTNQVEKSEKQKYQINIEDMSHSIVQENDVCDSLEFQDESTFDESLQEKDKICEYLKEVHEIKMKQLNKPCKSRIL